MIAMMLDRRSSMLGNNNQHKSVDLNNRNMAIGSDKVSNNPDALEGWWHGSLEARNVYGYDSPTHVQSLSGCRVFRGGIKSNIPDEDVWDMSELLAEMKEYEQQRKIIHSALLHGVSVPSTPRYSIAQNWLMADRSNGFIHVFPTDGKTTATKIPCRLTTTAHDVCLQLGVASNALHVLIAGALRRLDPQECPLCIQNDYLTLLGHTAIADIQQEGSNEDLSHMLKFYAGKPLCSKLQIPCNRLEAAVSIKKGGMLKQWQHRLCVLSDTRLLIYKDKNRRHDPYILQLAGAVVETAQIKGHELSIKLTKGESVTFMSFSSEMEYNDWLTKCIKVAEHKPLAADLSHCFLEYFPANMLINDNLKILNLNHNKMLEHGTNEDVNITGWLNNLTSFTNLSSLNLAYNDLGTFPDVICSLVTLSELNVAGNRLCDVPTGVEKLRKLRVLHLHNNHLTALPDELVGLGSLCSLSLAFNRFAVLPAVAAQVSNIRLTDVECISIAGNQIERLSSEVISEMRYVRRLDLRLNALVLPSTETLKFTILERLTHLDVRDNRITELDLFSLKSLEYLNCDRNSMTTLHVNGTALRTLFAANNRLKHLEIEPKPDSLLQLDLSRNRLESLPAWLGDCYFLHTVDVCRNMLTRLPQRLFADSKKLRILHAGYNRLDALPDEFDTLFLETIEVQCNHLSQLPVDFLVKANRLKVFNVSKNRLKHLPTPNNDSYLNRIEEMYLSWNDFGNDVMEVVSRYPRLRLLHLAYNDLNELYDSEIKKLEELCEVNISGNQLTVLPSSLGHLPKLSIVRAHSNLLHSLPDLRAAPLLQVLDVGRNQLVNVSVTQLMASQINLFDMSMNSQLKIDPDEYKTAKNKKRVCLIDLTGQNRPLPGLKQNATRDGEEHSGDEQSMFKIGFSESRGDQKKLSVATLRLLKFGTGGDSLFGMVDGHDNDEIPGIVADNVANILLDAMTRYDVVELRSKHVPIKPSAAFEMTGHLKESGESHGASCALVHLHRQSVPGGSLANQYVINVCNVGDVEAVLCRRGEPVMLTRRFTTSADRDECHRINKADGVITDDGKVNGVIVCTRQLGHYNLYPHVIPDPHVSSYPMTNDDEFIVVANALFWTVVSPSEAVAEICNVPGCIAAAKRLHDLAQSCGARGNVSVLVVRPDVVGESARIRTSRHDLALMSDHNHAKAGMSVSPVIQQQQQVASIVTSASGKYRAPQPSRNSYTLTATATGTEQSNMAAVPIRSNVENISSPPVSSSSSTREQEQGEFVRAVIHAETVADQRQLHNLPTTAPSKTLQVAPIKPLPRQRFVKKGAASDWDSIIQNRLSTEVKDQEIKQVNVGMVTPVVTSASSSSGPSFGSLAKKKHTLDDQTSSVQPVYFASTIDKNSTLLRRGGPVTATVNPSWTGRSQKLSASSGGDSVPNPAYAAFEADDDDVDDMIEMMMSAMPSNKKRQSVADTVAMFEQNKPPPPPANVGGSVMSLNSSVSNQSSTVESAKNPSRSNNSSVSSNSGAVLKGVRSAGNGELLQSLNRDTAGKYHPKASAAAVGNQTTNPSDVAGSNDGQYIDSSHL